MINQFEVLFKVDKFLSFRRTDRFFDKHSFSWWTDFGFVPYLVLLVFRTLRLLSDNFQDLGRFDLFRADSVGVQVDQVRAQQLDVLLLDLLLAPLLVWIRRGLSLNYRLLSLR